MTESIILNIIKYYYDYFSHLIIIFDIIYFTPVVIFYSCRLFVSYLQKVIFDNQQRETAVRSTSIIHNATTWDGTITFENIQNYENKVVELQIIGYRLRALQHYRYVFNVACVAILVIPIE